MDISWTKFDAYNTCQLKYHLMYEKRVRRAKASLNFAVGSVTHSLIEGWAKAGFDNSYFTAATIRKEYNDYMSQISNLSAETYERLLKKTVDAVRSTAKTYMVLRIPEHKHSVEPRFSVPLGKGDNLIGGWDLLDEDTKTIYDIKCYSKPSETNMGQLETYVLAAGLQGIQANRVGIITPLLDTKIKTEVVTGDAVRKRKGTLEQALVSMKQGVRPEPTEGSHCYFCDFNRTPYCPATYKITNAVPSQNSRAHRVTI